MRSPIAGVASWLGVASSVLVATALLIGGCSSDPAAPPADFCGVARSSNLSCAEPTDCDATFGTTCASLPKVLSGSAMTAAKDCLDSGVCGVASCLSRSAKGAVPGAAHAQLAADFCAVCAPTLEGCEANFYKRAAKGAGLLVLPYSDAIIAEIDASCTAEPGCQAKFQVCAAGVVEESLGADVDAETARCLVDGFNQDTTETPLGPDGKPLVVTCTPANCDGCCREDKCETGDVVTGCGAGAAACEICSGAQECLAGKCKEPCGPNNCAGCCDGDTCVDGTTTALCGERGGACTKCTGTFTCSNHACVDSSCVATCTSGCCTAAGCQTGNTVAACGTGGEACIACGAGRTCNSASCTLDTTSLWDVYISFAVLPNVDKKGATWDLLKGAPDPYLFVFTSQGAVSHSGVTTTKTDSTVPFWAETPVKSVKASELLENLSIEIWDYDETNNDDFIGGCKIPLTASQFDGSLQEVDCAASASGVPVTVDYRINAHTP
ncbi:MAG: putative lipoprotein [Labilithrix sp.]|nr:putative lipoprotein [Labilithrix sp.]